MTNWEAIAAAAVALFGAWVFWPCLLAGFLLTAFGLFAGGLHALDAWQAWRERRRKRSR